ncbi:copper resistance protein B [Leucothrix sargassi]|nr:copper resistance protein B [Leucothrix sargassi]
MGLPLPLNLPHGRHVSTCYRFLRSWKMIKQTVSLIALGVSLSPSVYAAHKPVTMDCSQPMHAKMSFCKDQEAKPAAKAMVDHSKMDHSKMNHAAMATAKPAAKAMVDHSKMDHSKMDHAAMATAKPAAKAMVDHSKMDHSKMNHAEMGSTKIPVSDGSMATNVPMPFPGAMHMEDDPTLSKLMIHALEYQYIDSDNDALTLDAEAWVGKDINKLWLKTDIEVTDGEVEEAELQVLYNRAIDPYWDFQIGVRKDFEPVSREWGVIGLQGTAPYMVDVDASLHIGKGGQIGARLNAGYEMMLSQKTVLAPELGATLYSKDDDEAEIGSGLSEVDLSLRLIHEFKREFAPYIGVNWSKSFGNTADLLKEHGEKTSDTKLLLGIEAWF